MGRVPDKIKDLKRFKEIVQKTAKYGFSHALHTSNIRKSTKKSKKIATPRQARLLLESLGGIFVKLGQFLSLRPDLIPQKYCDEFRNLQDNVKPFSKVEAENILKQQLGNKAKSVKLSKLIAAASIGQVYKADINNHCVAIKIQRPGIEQTFKSDISILYVFAQLLQKRYHKIFDPMEIFEQFQLYTKNELDYINEGKNLDNFHNNALKRPIVIPHVFWDYTTKKILTMDFIEGKKLMKVKLSKEEKTKVAQELLNEILHEVFDDGLFHADPHPGNIIITSDKKVCFLDFGIVGHLNNQLKSKLKDLFIAVMLKDVSRIVDAFVNLDIVQAKVDKDSLSEEIYLQLKKYYDSSVDHIDMVEFMQRCLGIAGSYNMKMPAQFVLLLKSFVTIEGVCAKLDRSFNFFKGSQPVFRSIMNKHANPKHIAKRLKSESYKFAAYLARVPDSTEKLLANLDDMDEKWSHIDKELTTLSKNISYSSRRLVFGMILSAVIIAFALSVNSLGTYSIIFLVLGVLALIFIMFN